MKKLIIIFLFTLISVYGQDLRKEIEAKLPQAINGSEFEVAECVDVNRMLGEYKAYEPAIEDPYGTLKDCVIFTFGYINELNNGAHKLGVYKNGQVIWICEEDHPFVFRLVTTRDVNRDGKVEILIGFGNPGVELWVYTWDGQSAYSVTELEEGETGSNLWMGRCEGMGNHIFFDIEGDGIDEINVGGTEYVFHWNGQKYVFDESIKFDEDKFYPRGNISAEITAKVTKSDTLFVYSYKVKNLLTSYQRIYEFYVEFEDSLELLSEFISPNGWEQTFSMLDEFAGWSPRIFYTPQPRDILVGKSQDGFIVKTKGYPIIREAILRGHNMIPDVFKKTDEESKHDEYYNSKRILTLGITKWDSVSNSEIIDSLVQYTIQSLELNWIKSSQISDKYSTYLIDAKNKLNKENNSAAKTELEKLITDVEIDSLQYLTDEVYALLKYNSEYLLSQISEDKPADAKAIIEQLKVLNDECKTNGWYTADWAHNVQKIAIDNGIMMLNLNVPASTLIIMEQFNITMDYYKTAGFLTQQGYDLLKPQNDLLIKELKRITGGGN
ncbi:MAG: hypothetical protein ACEPO8_09220, partial [Rhodothermaceae bacterium]